jgi:hypothetical protein
MPPRIEPPPSPLPVFGPPPSRPCAPSPPFGSTGVGDGRGTAGAVASGVGSVVGDGACAITSTCGSSAFATTEASGDAFTVGCFDFTALGPAPFLSAVDGDGAEDWAISVIGKLAPACCEARFNPDVVASCRSRLRSSLIARFDGALPLPHAARATADRPTANIEDLETLRTCASKAKRTPTEQWVMVTP